MKNRKTDLLLAISDDLPGLYVHGRSEEQLQERIPGAITEILEMTEGLKVLEVELVDPYEDAWEMPALLTANAQVEMAA